MKLCDILHVRYIIYIFLIIFKVFEKQDLNI